MTRKRRHLEAIHVSPVFSTGGWFSPQMWRLDAGLCLDALGTTWLIAKGFLTDFASIPRLIQWLFSAWVIFGPWAVWHDWIYKTGKLSKWLADAGAFELLKDEAFDRREYQGKAHSRWRRFLSWLCRATIWFFLCTCGWLAWWKHRRQERLRMAARSREGCHSSDA